MESRMRMVMIVAGLAPLALLGACSGPGRCIGVESPGAPAGRKVLQNLDPSGVAIDGYDPVAFFEDHRPIKGDPAIRSVHHDAVYLFSTAQHKAAFDATPAKYEPQFGGYCAYAASIDAVSPIDVNYWEIVDGRLLLQHNQKAWDLWHKNASENLVKADRNWPGIVDRNGSPPRSLVNIDESGLALDGYDPTAYFLDGRPRRGDPALARTFRGATYRFVDKAHKDAFEKEPVKYLPAYGGFCGYAASIDRVSPVDPTIWQLVDGRLVLQHTPEAYRLFNQDVMGAAARADKNWPGLSHRRCGE